MISVEEKSGIRVDWLDHVIGEVSSRWDHAVLANKETHLSNQVAKLREELGRADEQLGEVRAKMALRNLCSGLVCALGWY